MPNVVLGHISSIDCFKLTHLGELIRCSTLQQCQRTRILAFHTRFYRDFYLFIFDAPAFSTPAFSVVPISDVFITVWSSYASAVLTLVILSVRLYICPSVRHARALWRNERRYCRYFDITWKDNHSGFMILAEVRGRWPLPLEICA